MISLRNTGSRPEAGFTLLEVMVAVAIIAIAMVTLLGSQSQSVSVADRGRYTVDVALLAQHRLALLETEPFEDIASDSGDFGEDYPGFAWRTEVEEISGEDLDLKDADGLLKRVDLVVFRGDDEDQGLRLRTIVMANQVEPKTP